MLNDKAAMFDVIAIGDTTQDVFLEMADADLQCDEEGGNCKICFDYADKIAVEKKTDIPAVGNAANHAIGAARLGLKSAIYTVVGDDVQGHLSIEVFRENDVDTRYVAFDGKRETNFSAVINYRTERTIFVYHEPRDYRLPQLLPTKWVYLTSASGGGVQSLHEQVLRYLEDIPGVKLAFNPGTHQIHLGLEALKPVFARTEILFLNREESGEILGMSSDNMRELINGFHQLGVKTMVVTDGPRGSYASDGEKIWYLGIYDGPVVERTGAGDSFGVGFLAALVNGKSIPDAMTWGNANSTSVVRYIGAREGLLRPAQVAEMVNANARVKPEEYTGN